MQPARPFALSAVDAFLRAGRADRWASRAAAPPRKATAATAKARTSSATPTAVRLPAESWLRLRLDRRRLWRSDLQIRVDGGRRTVSTSVRLPSGVAQVVAAR